MCMAACGSSCATRPLTRARLECVVRAWYRGTSLALPWASISAQQTVLICRRSGQSHRLYRRNHHDGPVAAGAKRQLLRVVQPCADRSVRADTAVSPEFQRVAPAIREQQSGLQASPELRRTQPRYRSSTCFRYRTPTTDCSTTTTGSTRRRTTMPPSGDTRLDWNIDTKDTAYSSLQLLA